MEKFDVIVVKIRLAGLAAAWTLAGEDVEVVGLERVDYPGSKNVSVGRLDLNSVRDHFPGLWDHAPFERANVREGPPSWPATAPSTSTSPAANSAQANPRAAASSARSSTAGFPSASRSGGRM